MTGKQQPPPPRRRLVGKQSAAPPPPPPAAPPPRDRIREVYDELNFPNSKALKTVLKKRGIPFTDASIKEVVEKSGAKQVYAPRSDYPGKIASTAPDTRWAADTIQLVSQPSKPGGEKYILCAQDIFTRELFAKPLMNVTSAVVAQAFDEMTAANGVPDQLSTDGGEEFRGQFQIVLRRLGITHRLKVGKNDLATLDRKIGMIKEALFKYTADKDTADWASRVAKVVAGINQTPTEPLMGSAPDYVEDDGGILEFALRRQGAVDMQQNEKIS